VCISDWQVNGDQLVRPAAFMTRHRSLHDADRMYLCVCVCSLQVCQVPQRKNYVTGQDQTGLESVGMDDFDTDMEMDEVDMDYEEDLD
jgi:hypothetical protein